jgi:putative nucleotidyltransferase with HDIG domain
MNSWNTKDDTSTAYRDFITALMVAVSNCSLYTREHEAFDELAKRVYATLKERIASPLSLKLIDNELVVNDLPMRDGAIHTSNLARRLRKKGVSGISIDSEVTFSEIRRLIVDLSSTSKGMVSCPHIKTGIIDIGISGELDRPEDPVSSFSENKEKVRELIHEVSPFRKLNVAGLEEVVVEFISTFKREASILGYLTPVKTYDEYTYTHATNVAVLTVMQAESLGVDGDTLHEIGVAALLHDTGKMFVPREILEKKGRLDEAEFNEMKNHTVHGARYLARIDDLTRLAPIIAFEHHMKFDGSGYPDPAGKGMKKKQHIYSQIVAIADFFDALRSNRPYRSGMEISEIFVLMKKGAGKDFNPYLVDNFLRLMKNALSLN